MMIELAAALMCFLLPHAIPSIPGLKPKIINVMGRAAYLSLYIVISAVTFIWLIVATLNAPYIELWIMRPWMIYAVILLIAGACILLVTGLLSPNPLSLSLRNSDPQSPLPAILSYTRHPLLWGFGLWGVSHVLVNGDLAAILLFGILALFSLGYMPLMDKRMQRDLGKERWTQLSKHTSVWLFGSLVRGQVSTLWDADLAKGVMIGLITFFVLLILHEPVIGFDPITLIR